MIKAVSAYLLTFCSALIALLLLPVLSNILGPELYGIITVGLLFQSLVFIFEGGATATLKRNIALSNNNLKFQKHHLVIAAEITLTITFILVLIIYAIMSHWIGGIERGDGIRYTVTIERSIILFSFILLYNSICHQNLIAADKQGIANFSQLINIVLRNISALVLVKITTEVEVYFYTQAFFALITALFQRQYLLGILKKNEDKDLFESSLYVAFRELRKGFQFIALTLVSLLNYNIDKVIVLSLISTSLYSIYSTAFIYSNVMISLVNPLLITLTPFMIRSYFNGRAKDLTKFLHLIRSFIFLVCLGVILLSINLDFILGELFHSSILKEGISDIFIWFVLAAVCHIIQSFPYVLAQAHFRIRSVIYINILVSLGFGFIYYIFGSEGDLNSLSKIWFFHSFMLCLINSYIYLLPLDNIRFSDLLYEVMLGIKYILFAVPAFLLVDWFSLTELSKFLISTLVFVVVTGVYMYRSRNMLSWIMNVLK